MSRGNAGFRGAWSHRRWRWLIGGTAVSATAHEISVVALVVVVVDMTGSVGWLGTATALRVALLVLLGPIAGSIASRRRRRRLLVGLDIGRGMLAAAAFGAVRFDAPVVTVVAATVLATVTMVPSRAAVLAATPNVVDVDDLAAATAAVSIAGDVALFTGPALAALAIGLAGPEWAFVASSGLALLAAAALRRCGDVDTPSDEIESMAVIAPGGTDPDRPMRGTVRRSMWGGIVESGRSIRASTGLMALLAVSGAMMFLAGAESVVHVLVAQDVVDRGAEWVGVMGATAGGVGILAAPLATRLSGSAYATWWLVAASTTGGVSFALLGVSDSVLVVLAFVAISGASWMVIGVVFITLIQRWTRERALPQMLGIHESLVAATEMGGALAATALISTASLNVALGILGAVVALTCLALAPPMRAEAIRFESVRTALLPRVERFRRVSMLEGASTAVLERLARAARQVEVRRGECVVAEGAASDTVYVVVAGTFAASSFAQGELSRMGPDDWFGEIGVIGRRPRTASVHAVEDGGLLAIDAATFLAAVGGGVSHGGGAFAATVSRRLARTEGSGST